MIWRGWHLVIETLSKNNKYGLQFYIVRGWSFLLFLMKNFVRTLNLLNFKNNTCNKNKNSRSYRCSNIAKNRVYFRKLRYIFLIPNQAIFSLPTRYRCCGFLRVIKQYAIRKNDLSNKEKMFQTNGQTFRKNASNKWHFFLILRLESRTYEAMYRSRANQYSCLTYTAWVETLYTAIGRTAILLLLHEQNYNGTMAKYAFRCVTHSVYLQYQYRIVTTGILLN